MRKKHTKKKTLKINLRKVYLIRFNIFTDRFFVSFFLFIIAIFIFEIVNRIKTSTHIKHEIRSEKNKTKQKWMNKRTNNSHTHINKYSYKSFIRINQEPKFQAHKQHPTFLSVGTFYLPTPNAQLLHDKLTQNRLNSEFQFNSNGMA